MPLLVDDAFELSPLMSSNVGMAPLYYYNEGLVTQTGFTVTGSDGNFTADMVGGVLQFASDQTATCAITDFVDGNTLTVDVSQEISSPTQFTVWYGGVQWTNSGALFAANALFPNVEITSGTFTTIQNTTSNILINTTGAGKTVRINSRTESTDTANSLIGFQSKVGRGISAATNIIGGEISPRINDAIALTGSGSCVGLHVDFYLKGTTGNIAGDVRGQQIELVDDTGSSRTVAGYMTHLRIRSNVSCTVTGKYSALRVENEEGTKAMDALVQFTTGSGCLVESSGTVGGTQDKAIKILIDSTTLYVPLYTSVS